MSEYIQFSGKLEDFPSSPLWGHHVMVPDPIAAQLKKDNNTRAIVVINTTKKIHCALMPDGKGGVFIMLNKEIRTKLKLNLGDDVSIEIKSDTSKYGMEMPEEFSELLELDEEGSTIFHSLTTGKQRTLIHLVGKNKQSDTRIKKAITILDYLKHTQGNLDFKELNLAFKNANKR